MKTIALVVLGLLLGAAGYAWLYGFDNGSTGNDINRALIEASGGAAQAPAGTQTATQAGPIASPSAPASTVGPAPASPSAPAAEAGHDPVAAKPATAGAATAPAAPAPASPGTGDAALLLPVQGVTRADLHDTFSDARSEGRVHDAIDIMAAAGTPVLAVADGTVEKLFDSKRGGLTIYQFEPSGRYAYYYAHLQQYAEGLAEKQPIKRGQVIGYVGSTGNADPSAPHLHFAIFRLGPERRWWEGEAINPYPVLHDGQPL